MKIADYSIDLEKVTKSINDNNYKIVAIQIPEGLKKYVSKIVEFIKKHSSVMVIVNADPCFGACDIAKNELLDFGVEFIIHIGHTPIPDIKKYSIPTTFVNALSNKDINKVVEKSLKYLEGSKIGIVTTAQHIHKLNFAEVILKKNNFIPLKSCGNKKISSEGQILGCNFSAGLDIVDEVDSYLFIGSGIFHPVGLLLSSKKPVIAADPYTNTIKKEEIDELKDIFLRQRYGAIANSKNAKMFGILISIKKGQQRKELMNKIKKMLEDYKKKYLIISMDYFSPDSIQGFRDVDCLVSTACPRVAIDDYLKYKIPIITPIELEIVLGIRGWDEYKLDQILG